jgi:hypothetical protein
MCLYQKGFLNTACLRTQLYTYRYDSLYVYHPAAQLGVDVSAAVSCILQLLEGQDGTTYSMRPTC